MIKILVLLLATGLQDDVSRLLDKLRSDDFYEREEASRALERMGPAVLERLKLASEKADELDLKLRLKDLLVKIPKLAELSKVYGPTHRISLSAKDEKLGEVLQRLGTALGDKVRGEGVDLEARITVELKEATLWEALDGLSRAGRMRYSYRKDGILFKPGEAPPFPVVYYEQFRISLAEVKRIDYRAPGESDRGVVVVPEVRYQRNLLPAGDKYEHIFAFTAVTDPKGNDARSSRPSWIGGTVASRRHFGLQEFLFVRSDAGTFSIEGTATVNFAQENREITLPVEGENREMKTADGTYRVVGLTVGTSVSTLTLEMKLDQIPDPDTRVQKIWLADGDGKRHEGSWKRASRESDAYRAEFQFPGGLKGVKNVVFSWATDLRAIAIPFILRDIKVP